MLFQKVTDGVKTLKGNANNSRAHRRKAITNLLWNHLLIVKSLLFLVGYIWMLFLPFFQLSQNIYIDENALQPAQVSTYWSWADVHRADNYLRHLETLRDTNATSLERSEFIRNEFLKLGIASSIQNYRFHISSGNLFGSNVYAILSSPRSSGTETILISASWISRTNDGEGTLNLRGVSTVLALAAFLKQYSLWAKDLAFVISDGYLDGMQAWIGAYHGHEQDNLNADPLQLNSGTIWTALNIDYPGHSFSHLGMFFEGLNGRLPNQDLLNSFHIISRHTGGVPVVLYDHLDPNDHPDRLNELISFPSWFPSILKHQLRVQDYAYRAKNLWLHFSFQSRGKASGLHGLLHQYRIDAFTIFAVPATGPHGFHAIGRIVESTLRTTNNLLERLHASFFFYLLPAPASFMKIGFYLPSIIVVSTAMIFGGLGEWTKAGWVQTSINDPKPKLEWKRRSRPVIKPLSIMAVTHLSGVFIFRLLNSSLHTQHKTITLIIVSAIITLLPIASLLFSAHPTTPHSAPASSLLKAFNLCLASTVISITSVLNFSLAAWLAILLGIPLSISRPSCNPSLRFVQYIFYMMFAFYGIYAKGGLVGAIWDWEVLGVWFAPFVSVVYVPLVLQAAIVALLPS